MCVCVGDVMVCVCVCVDDVMVCVCVWFVCVCVCVCDVRVCVCGGVWNLGVGGWDGGAWGCGAVSVVGSWGSGVWRARSVGGQCVGD